MLSAASLSPALATPAKNAPRWITLGTSGGPQVQAARAQISNAFVAGGKLYLFDLGNDVQRQIARAGLRESDLVAAFLSHHHLDHNADLGPVMMTHWLFGRGRLPVYGPAGTETLVAGLAAANAPTALASFPTAGPAKPPVADSVKAVDLNDLREPFEVYRDENLTVFAISVDHYHEPPSVPLPVMPQALAYRVEAGGRSFVYSGDTGPSAGLVRLARGADYLLCEVVDLDAIARRILATMPDAPAAVRDRVVAGMRVNHMIPEEIGKLAAAAGVGCVVLTHFVPIPEQIGRPRILVDGVRRHFKGRVVMARDLASFF